MWVCRRQVSVAVGAHIVREKCREGIRRFGILRFKRAHHFFIVELVEGISRRKIRNCRPAYGTSPMVFTRSIPTGALPNV